MARSMDWIRDSGRIPAPATVEPGDRIGVSGAPPGRAGGCVSFDVKTSSCCEEVKGVAEKDLRAELNPYDPPTSPQAYAWTAIIGVLVIVAIVLSVLYGWGVFD